ncbi:MAG TPA: hypothetical protein VNI54_05270 [Thermoanaerobaculia bacterium]|nr:hypothetical protein [Thermoanaerobaculia bacterium]
MRRVFSSFVAVAVVVIFAGTVSAAPRERERSKEKVPAVVKMLKKIVRGLGDGLTPPLPRP